MSTVWFAEHVSFILTIEATREWHDWVCRQLEARALAHVEVRLRQNRAPTPRQLPERAVPLISR
jgi:hypothetical protein